MAQVLEEISKFVQDVLTLEWPCTYDLRGLSDLSPVFAGVSLKIFNGTVIDPSRNDEFAEYLRGKGRDELEQQLIHEQGRHGQSRDEAMLRLAKCSTNTAEGYRPLTPHGYRMLQQNVEEGKACILVFGGRFFTLLKHDRQLYVLATDTALKEDDRIVWQRLNRIYDDTECFVGPNFLPVVATAEIEDFTIDLDWSDGDNEFSNESLREYQVLGYKADGQSQMDVGSSFDNRQMIEEQRVALEGITSPGGNGSDGVDVNTSDADEQAHGMSDEAYARLLQQEMNIEAQRAAAATMAWEQQQMAAGGASAEVLQPVIDEMAGSPQLVQSSDLEAALSASFRATEEVRGGQYGQGSTRAAPQGDETKRWNLDLIIALEVRNKYYFTLDMKYDKDENWEIWDRGGNTIRAWEEDLYHPTQLPLSLESEVLREIRKIMCRKEKIIPKIMRKAAIALEAEEILTRPEEHARLSNLLQNGEPLNEADEGRAAHGAVDSGSGRTARTAATRARAERIGASARAVIGVDDYNSCSDSDEAIPDLVDYSFNNALRKVAQPTVSPEEKGATFFQSIWRGHAARQDYTEQRLVVFSSSTTIQASWRSYTVRRDIKHNVAATSIQAPMRRFLEEKRYEKAKEAATRLAAVSRGLLARHYFLRILSSIKINAVVRGFLARRRYGDAIRVGFEEWKHVNELWGPVRLCVTKASASDAGLFSWYNIKKMTFDINQAEERDEEDQEVTSRVDAAREGLASDDDNDDGNAEESANDGPDHDNAAVSAKTVVRLLPSEECDRLPLDAYDNIMLTRSVIKWFNRADSVYRGFFLRRMRQFANGEYERSQKLRKNLTGCKHIIYEAYLEQKVAQRILFTECRTKDDEGNVTTSILVWYVAKHDYVPRYMGQIDKAEARMNDQFTASASQLIDENRGSDSDDGDNEGKFEGADAMILGNDTILLDPLANTPLKIHQLSSTEIDKLELEKWTPPFRLTTEEKQIVQTPGTVLVLGRSGTGKTVCIVNRMVCDATHRTRTGHSPLKQLFISRSSKIKNLVKKLVEDVMEDPPNVERAFSSYERIIRDCNAALTNFGLPTSVPAMEQSKLQQDFSGFKEGFFKAVKKGKKVKLSALVVWTQIR